MSNVQPLPRMLDIASDVAARHGVSLADLRGPSRRTKITVARQEAYAACRAVHRWSYTGIGRFFRRDHTSVLHGVRRHNARTGTEPMPRPKPALAPVVRIATPKRIVWHNPPTPDAQAQLAACLLFQKGPDRAAEILTGQEDETNADIQAWRNLGEAR